MRKFEACTGFEPAWNRSAGGRIAILPTRHCFTRLTIVALTRIFFKYKSLHFVLTIGMIFNNTLLIMRSHSERKVISQSPEEQAAFDEFSKLFYSQLPEIDPVMKCMRTDLQFAADVYRHNAQAIARGDIYAMIDHQNLEETFPYGIGYFSIEPDEESGLYLPDNYTETHAHLAKEDSLKASAILAAATWGIFYELEVEGIGAADPVNLTPLLQACQAAQYEAIRFYIDRGKMTRVNQLFHQKKIQQLLQRVQKKGLDQDNLLHKLQLALHRHQMLPQYSVEKKNELLRGEGTLAEALTHTVALRVGEFLSPPCTSYTTYEIFDRWGVDMVLHVQHPNREQCIGIDVTNSSNRRHTSQKSTKIKEQGRRIRGLDSGALVNVHGIPITEAVEEWKYQSTNDARTPEYYLSLEDRYAIAQKVFSTVKYKRSRRRVYTDEMIREAVERAYTRI